MFSLTGGGKYNFLGTKRWIEENLDHAGEITACDCADCEPEIDPKKSPLRF